MITLIGIFAAWTVAYLGYRQSRRFVRERLRYVEGVHKFAVPIKVGALATLASLPVAWLLPIITSGAALMFGAGVGLGVASGRRDIRARRYLNA